MYPPSLQSSRPSDPSLGSFLADSKMQSWPLRLVSLLSHVFDLASLNLCNVTVAASLNVLSLYHDTLLARIIEAEPKHQPLLPPSLHTRYTRAWADNCVRYKWIARVLELVRFTELLIEMGLRRRFSEKGRWRGIVLLEAIKYVHILHVALGFPQFVCCPIGPCFASLFFGLHGDQFCRPLFLSET